MKNTKKKKQSRIPNQVKQNRSLKVHWKVRDTEYLFFLYIHHFMMKIINFLSETAKKISRHMLE